MATLLFIMILLAGYHFIYDSIIAPSARLSLRYKLFKERDKLVCLKIEKGQEINQDVFLYMNNSINGIIHYLPHFNFSLFVGAIREFEHNEEFQKRVDKRVDLIKSCDVKEVNDIYSNMTKYVSYALIFNLGSWVIYILPLFLILFLVKGAKRQIQKLSITSENEMSRLVPNSDLSLV